MSPRAGLNGAFYCFRARIGTVWFGAGITNQVTVTVEARDKHWAVVLIATRLVTGKDRWFAGLWGYVPKAFAEAARAKLCGTSKELNRIVCTERCNASHHGAVVLITEG